MEFKKRKPKIFIISGKAESGKNTVSDFIGNYAKLKGLKHIDLQFSSYIKMYAKNISGWSGNEDDKPRLLLQQLGTDIIRKKIDQEFFIKRIIGDIMVYSYYFDVITISDARLPMELECISKVYDNVYKLNIVRPNYSNRLSINERNHVTENLLDSYDNYDFKIVNSGSLDDLNNIVINYVKEVL